MGRLRSDLWTDRNIAESQCVHGETLSNAIAMMNVTDAEMVCLQSYHVHQPSIVTFVRL